MCPTVLKLRSAPEGNRGSGFFRFDGFCDISNEFTFDPASPPTKKIQTKMRQLQAYIEQTSVLSCVSRNDRTVTFLASSRRHGSIVTTELEIGLTAPGLRNLTLVDLPGTLLPKSDDSALVVMRPSQVSFKSAVTRTAPTRKQALS